MCCMAMGTRQSEQASMWVVTAELPKSPGHPFYTRLNALLDADNFDRFVEGQCVRFYAPVMGRPSLALGRYFRCCWSATLKRVTGHWPGASCQNSDRRRKTARKPQGLTPQFRL